MTFNNTNYTPSQCASHALLFSILTRSTAITLWLNSLCIALPYTLFASWWCANRTIRAATSKAAAATTSTTSTTASNIDAIARPSSTFFGRTEKWFCASTVCLSMHALIFLAMALAIQAQRYCSGGAISDANYIFQWVLQGLLGGGTLGGAWLCWWSSLLAVKSGGRREGEEGGGANVSVQWWWVFKWEGYVIASPFILLAMGVVVLVKGPEAWRESRVGRAWRDWRSVGRSSSYCSMGWSRGPAERMWWGGRRRETPDDAVEKPAAWKTSFEKRHWPTSWGSGSPTS